MNFLCAVSSDAPENYEIGRREGVWGVVERYEGRIRETSVGDLVTFIVEGRFRSIHRIESEVYHDSTVVWPHWNGSVYPFRVRISEPLFAGSVPVSELAERISFMKGKSWVWTIRGASGVFNQRLTDEDQELIRQALEPYRLQPAKPQLVAERATPQVSLRVFEEQLQAALSHLLDQLGLEQVHDEEGLEELVRYRDSSGVTLRARDRATKAFVILVMDTGEGGSGLILHVLRQISALRQRFTKGREIRGVILTDRVRDDLRLVAREIPNLSVHGYRMRFELDPEPEAGNNGWHAA